MKLQNHEETIMRAYVWSLHANGEAVEEAKQIAKQSINLFKRAEGDEIRAMEGHTDPVPIYTIAKYVAEKYLTSLNDFIKEAESKRTLHDLDMWWKQHQGRVKLNLSEHDFNEFAIKIMPSLRSKFEGEEGAACAILTEDEQVQPEDYTDLIVDIRPGKMVSSTFPAFSKFWNNALEEAKNFVPQSEDDLKRIREHEKACKNIENKISEVLEKALMGDPKIQSLVEDLKKLGGKTRASRLDAGKIASEWMDNQKSKVVTEHLARVKDAADKLFVGEIAKGRDDADVKGRLVASYKGKRTVDTVKQAVEEEAGRIIDEMNDRAARCRSNLEKIEASGRPALFQDQDFLMTLDTETLEQQVTIRIQQDDLLKTQVQRHPQKLANWKATIADIDNVPHLDNWYLKHWDEVKESLPHEKDREELLQYCGERKQALKAEYAKSAANNPPPPESPQQEQPASHHVAYRPAEDRKAEPTPPPTSHQETTGEEEEGPEEINLMLKFTIFGTVEQAKEIAGKVYNLIGENPLLQADQNGNKVTMTRI